MSPKIRRPLFLLALSLPLLSCAIRDPTVGTGPIQLSPRVQAGLEQYRQERVPAHFAVSIDGQTYAYTYCPEANCRRGDKTRAVEDCERRSRGTPCKIYAAYGQVVWRTDVPAN